jgi:hypothetical protein
MAQTANERALARSMKRRKLRTNSAAFGLAPGNSADADQLEDERNPLIPPERGSIPVAFPISQGAVIIDFCGPWEVFHSADIPGRGGEVFQTYTVAETLEPITASGA